MNNTAFIGVLSLDMSGNKLLTKKWLAPQNMAYWTENFDTAPSGKRKVILS